ncbi:hypothetical protein ASE40_20640 [Flavobacterium sp. Root935]|uniref:hypothetical protein n=1 Tax=Flavobacterium sp. Root935 TaxID=1736610 RepID=UPI00070F1FDF|nr:hypothetical protein [Flavobacterium sp. Root935]KRD58722.1 hypothetical protein ASE40_20640 [Flavobacterium sp. Root935]
MHIPQRKLSGEELKEFLTDASDYSMNAIKDYFSRYEPESLYYHWRLLIRSMDEFINLVWEIEDQQTVQDFLSLSFNFLDQDETDRFIKVYSEVLKQFGLETAERFLNFARMNFTITVKYEQKGINDQMDYNVAGVSSALMYYQSRRKFYVTLLDLIPLWAKGTVKIEYKAVFSHFHYWIENCLQTWTTLYYDTVLSAIYNNFSIDFSVQPPLKSHNYKNLEGFFLEPQIMNMVDVLTYRPHQVHSVAPPQMSGSKVFSFSEVESYIQSIPVTYQRYAASDMTEYIELKFLVRELREFCADDFNICVPKDRFDHEIEIYIKKIKMSAESDDYIFVSNFAPLFQLVGNVYYTTVVLLNRFITDRIQQALNRNKSFQIHSGFVFEAKIREILNKKGFKVTDITRIKRKEFDVITVKCGKIYNFQCKNNLIDISRVQHDAKMTVRWNNKLINYYKKAYKKELGREDLITEKLELDQIQHFVVSRYPVITDIDYIINFNELAEVIDSWDLAE